MAQFEAFNKDVEVNAQTVASVVNAMEMGKETRTSILKENNIDLSTQKWFKQQDWLNAFRQIAEEIGQMNLFQIGKAIIDNAQFPPISGLEEGLRSIDVAYHMNHRLNGKELFNPATGQMEEGIGHYQLTEFDTEAKKAVMVCNNPYPSKFDEGIIVQIVRRFKAKPGRESVTLDPTKPTRTKGADSCTYNISW